MTETSSQSFLRHKKTLSSFDYECSKKYLKTNPDLNLYSYMFQEILKKIRASF